MKPKDTPKQYVIYSRKSKFTGKGESIENQIELCRQYIAMHFGEEAAENVLVYEDFSGGNLERPQFKKMMKDSQKIAFAAVVVYRLDRISRNIGDFAERAEFDGEHGIMVYNRSLQRPGKANQIRPMEEDRGGGQASRHHRRRRLGAGTGHAGCEQIQELPQTPQQRGTAVPLQLVQLHMRNVIFLCQPPGQIRFPAAADDAELHIRPSLPVSARPGMRKDTAELCRVFLHILFPMRRLSPPCSSGSQRQ